MPRSIAAALAIAATLAGCSAPRLGAAAAPHPEAPRLTFTDLTDDFAALHDARAGATESERLQAIDEGMAAHLPGFYNPARFGEQAAMYERLAADFLATYPAQREAIADVAARFGRMFDPAVADFERRIGALPTVVPVYLVVSMGEFDGATRDLGGTTRLLFGADMIARLHGGEARAFVQHELFHIYHGARFSGCTEIWCALWNEGLAVHAAQQLNPDASDAELLLTLPEPIRPALDANRDVAICTTLAKLDSIDAGDRNTMFSSGRLAPGLPPRFGYLVGLWVAQELGRDATLAQMAEWDGPDLRARIGKALAGMADCSRAAID